MERFVVPKAEENNTQNPDSRNDFVTRKQSPNYEPIRRTDDREYWEAMMCTTDLAHDDYSSSRSQKKKLGSDRINLL